MASFVIITFEDEWAGQVDETAGMMTTGHFDVIMRIGNVVNKIKTGIYDVIDRAGHRDA